MWGYPKVFEKLVEEFAKLPTIGPKTAERLAFYLFKTSPQRARELAASIIAVKEKVGYCRFCNNIAEDKTCEICKDVTRYKDVICVVESPIEVIAIEKTAAFKGLYYCLMQLLSPLDGIGPNDLNLDKLIGIVKQNQGKEVIIATGYSAEGRATALYLTQIFSPMGIKVSRLAHGVPVGARLGFIDQETLCEAFNDRVELKMFSS